MLSCLIYISKYCCVFQICINKRKVLKPWQQMVNQARVFHCKLHKFWISMHAYIYLNTLFMYICKMQNTIIWQWVFVIFLHAVLTGFLLWIRKAWIYASFFFQFQPSWPRNKRLKKTSVLTCQQAQPKVSQAQMHNDFTLLSNIMSPCSEPF
jgi:hypothetical protein